MRDLHQYLLGSRGRHTKADYERMGDEAASQFLRKQASLNDAIAGIAREEGLNQHQVQLVAGFANTRVFHDKFEKMASPKVVEFPVADAKLILQKLGKKKTATPIRSFRPPSRYIPGGDRVDMERELFGEATLNKVAHPIEGPTRGEMELAWKKLGGELEKASSAFTAAQMHLKTAEAEFSYAVERALLTGEATLSDVVDAVSGVAPSPGVVKEAMGPVLDYLVEKNILTKERIGKQKVAHRVPDPNHPVVSSFLYLCKVATDLRANQLVALELKDAKNQVQDFLLGRAPKEKMAAWSDVGKYLGRGAAFAGGTLAAMGLFHGAAHLLDKHQENKLMRTGYSQALKENPDLKRLDQPTLKKHYKVLAKFNPDMAAEPTVAGSWLRMTSQRSDVGLDPKVVKDLVSIRKDYVSAKGDKATPSGMLRATGFGAGHSLMDVVD